VICAWRICISREKTIFFLKQRKEIAFSMKQIVSQVAHWIVDIRHWGAATLIPCLLLVLFFVSACSVSDVGKMFIGPAPGK
jgi:hypothetical protein